MNAAHEGGDIDADAGVAPAVGSNLRADGDVAEVDKHVDLSGASFIFEVLQGYGFDLLD